MAHVLRLYGNGAAATTPPGRAGIEALMALFPDKKE